MLRSQELQQYQRSTSVLKNDSDPEGDALTAVKVTNPSRGTVTLNANGTFLYTHDGSMKQFT